MGVEAPARATGRLTYHAGPGATSACFDVDFRLYAGEDGAARHHAVRRAGAEGRVCRRDGRGQDDDYQPDQPVLRSWRTARSGTTASTSTRSRRRTCAAALGIVLQDTNLFTGTVIRDNIRYGKLEATDAGDRSAAAQARGRGRLHHVACRTGMTRCSTGDGAQPVAGAAAACCPSRARRWLTRR